jgi:hypothetical protein
MQARENRPAVDFGLRVEGKEVTEDHKKLGH